MLLRFVGMATCTRLLQHLAVSHGCRHCHFTPGRLRNPRLLAAFLAPCRKTHFQRHLHSSFRSTREDPAGSAANREDLSAEGKRTLALSRNLFREAADKDSADKETFYRLVETFGEVDKRRRGHLQFIETALRYMKHFKVEKDVDAYNRLLDVFPKGVFVAKNVWQVIFNHFPEQQTVALKVLQRLEDNKLMPNNETKRILLAAFGRQSHPVKKYQRIMYWFPKFRNINPFPLPFELPTDPVQLSEIGLKRICEYEAELKVMREFADEEESPGEFLTSAQSPEQKDLLSQHPPYRPLYVEGPFDLWLRDARQGYYTLRSDAVFLDSLDGDMAREEEEEFEDDFSMRKRNPQEQLEGPVYAMCMSSKGSQERLSLWIKKLQEDNPHLARLPVIFNLFDKDTGGEDSEQSLEEGTKFLGHGT